MIGSWNKISSTDAVRHTEETSARLSDQAGYGQFLNRIGVSLAQRNQNDHAVTLFRQAAKVSPDDADVHSNLGWALIKSGRSTDAQASLQRALEIDDKWALAHAGQAILLTSSDEVAAEQKFRQALEYDAQLDMAYFGLVRLYEKQRRIDDAIATLAAAFQHGVEADGLHYKMGQYLRRVGRFQDAAAQFDAELERNPDHLPSLNDLSRILATHTDAAVRNGDRAVELARRAVAGPGAKNPYSHGALAAALAEVGRYEDALVAVQKALTIARSTQRESLLKQLELEHQAYQSGRPVRL